jgi:hypothetical protein
MRYGTLALAVMLSASMSVAAIAQNTKPPKQKRIAASAEPANPNEHTARFLWDSLPLWVPLPVRVFMLQQQSTPPKQAAVR